MTSTPTDEGSVEPTGQMTPIPGDGDAGGSPAPGSHADQMHPRLIEEHQGTGPYGEPELEATDELGRRWYHLRPEPRRRYDLVGFNYTWWLFWVILMLIIFLPWGHGWGY